MVPRHHMLNGDGQKHVVRTGWISMAVNLFLFGIKYWAGIVSGSIALKADAWDTLTDCLSSLIVIIGGRLAGKPADEEHPFGHGRAEHITAMAIGVILAILAYNFVVGAFAKFVARGAGNFGNVAFAVTIVSILAKELLARYELRMSRKTRSPALKANGWNHRTDALSSAMILIGIFLGQYFWWIDSVMAFFIACMIAYASYEILSKQVRALLGEEMDPALVAAITAEVRAITRFDVYIHHFHLHVYGQHKELSCHIKLPGQMPLEEVHQICSEIEQLIKTKFEITATIHPEPLT